LSFLRKFWAAAIDMKMPLTVHVGFDRLGPRAQQPTFEYPGADPEMLTIFFAETRLGWVPFWMEEADYWFERHRHWAERLLGFQPPKRRPSE
jgi:hypothetical protein